MSAAARGVRGRRRAGLVLVAIGLGLLGWVVYQTYGTNVVSSRHQAEAERELQRAWADGRSHAETSFGRATGILRIPRFGRDYAIPILEGVSDDVLAAGVGHVEGSADAGEIGNFALAGHRVTHGEPLRDMPRLEVGDHVIVETRTKVYTYELTTGGDDLEVPLTEGWVLDPKPVNPDEEEVGPPPSARLLTLTTCAELYHTDDRLVAFGRLIDVVATPTGATSTSAAGALPRPPHPP